MAFGSSLTENQTKITHKAIIQTPIIQTTAPTPTSLPSFVARDFPLTAQQVANYVPPVTGVQQNTPTVDMSETSNVDFIGSGNYSISARKVESQSLFPEYDKNSAELLKKSEQQRTASATANATSAVLGMLNASQYTKDVKSTRSQYESAKKNIDTNIMRTQELMFENYQENMGQLDAITAARNVDITSGGITGLKEKGLTDMGKDIRNMQEQATLSKKALDLDYAMNVASAKRSEFGSYASGAMNLGLTAMNYFG